MKKTMDLMKDPVSSPHLPTLKTAAKRTAAVMGKPLPTKKSEMGWPALLMILMISIQSLILRILLAVIRLIPTQSLIPRILQAMIRLISIQDLTLRFLRAVIRLIPSQDRRMICR